MNTIAVRSASLALLLLLVPGVAWADRFELGAGFLPDPQTGSGTAGGARDAAALGSSCVGNIGTSPNHVLVVTSEVNLEVWVESAGDASLAITGNGQTWCADSGHGGQNPALTRVFTPGTYQIWVGSKSGLITYTIGLTEAL